MRSDHALPSSRPRPFVTVAYVPDSGSALVPAVMPPSCVHASKGDPACVLVVHHTRERKAGPQISVTVAQCRTHRRAFTLYPLGHVPYGRLAVAPVTLDGQVVLSTQGEPAAGARRSPAWRATPLGAAFAAIEDPAVKVTDRRWWATQTPERLARSAALLGIHPGLSVPDAEAIAFRLDVPRLVLREAADAYAHARGRAGRGRVLIGVLGQLGADACLLDRILAAGVYAGCWGTVTRWDRASRGVRGQVFPGRGAPAG
jgi:hypothetical protein